MITIIDYGVGNLFSLVSSLSVIGAEARVASDPEEIRKGDRIILPGVGAFGDAAERLSAAGLDKVIKDEAARGKPLLGICLGMQLLFDKSYEYGCHEGLGLISGEVRPITEVIPKEAKVPHIGWNSLDFTGDYKNCPLFKYLHDGDYVYFVHSYYAAKCEPSVIATADYGAPLTAAVMNANVFGPQFHPEKSGDVGLSILKAFAEL